MCLGGGLVSLGECGGQVRAGETGDRGAEGEVAGGRVWLEAGAVGVGAEIGGHGYLAHRYSASQTVRLTIEPVLHSAALLCPVVLFSQCLTIGR